VVTHAKTARSEGTSTTTCDMTLINKCIQTLPLPKINQQFKQMGLPVVNEPPQADFSAVDVQGRGRRV